MNIRKKITMASVLMILIPIIVSVLLCIIVLFFQGSGTLNRMKDLYDNDNGLLNVQSILYNYKNNILSYKPTDDFYQWLQESSGEWEDDWDDEEDDWEDDEEDSWDEEDEDVLSEEERNRQNNAFGSMIKGLSAIGYSYEIYYDRYIIASSLSEDAEKEIAALAGAGHENLSHFALSDGKDSVVKQSYTNDGHKISVLAYCNDYVSDSKSSQVIREFLSILGIFSIILLVSVVISIFILTRWLSGGMKKSLLQLSEGVRQIQDGNLSYRIYSKKKDELGKACQEFDEMAEYLENSVKEREQYEEAKKQMLAGISHDLRTPMTSIKAYVEGLRDGIANTEQKKQRYYDALAIRIGDLEALIDNLSLFSRFDRGEYHFSMEKIDFREFLSSFFTENEIEFRENRVRIEKGEWPENKVFICGDQQQLKRVLGNLVENVVKYRDKPESIITISLYLVKDGLWMEITDNGPGVPSEERKKIFDTFYRGDKARQNPGNGSGLGLSIVKEIVLGHGGNIWADAGPGGKGLKMILEFPAANVVCDNE